jgi:hypothetical protein
MTEGNEMAIARRFLPSMSLLRAFDAAARHQSITAAAEELNLTQGAVYPSHIRRRDLRPRDPGGAQAHFQRDPELPRQSEGWYP